MLLAFSSQFLSRKWELCAMGVIN